MEASEYRSRAMASDVHIIVVGSASALTEDAMCYLDRLERRWSRFLPTSDITRINLSGGSPVAVAPETLTLVATMIDAWQITAGRFDPSILPALVANGYQSSVADSRRLTMLPDGPLRSRVMEDVELDTDHATITVPQGVMLDPGGIGKGLAADLVVVWLLARGAAGALVSIGGDLAMAGTPPDPEGWVVTIERADPSDGDVCSFAVNAGGVATSSTRSRRWMLDGRPRHHLIDPAVGRQADTDLAAVTVIAGSGWLAEAHATAALLAGRVGVLGYLEIHDLSGTAITADGSVVCSPDLSDLFETAGVR